MASRRTYVSAGTAVALLVACIVPWSSTLSVPVVMTAAQEARIYPPFAARIIDLALEEGAQVKAGDVLVRLEAPQLEQQRRLATERARLTTARLDRAAADQTDRALTVVLENELKSVREELAGLARTAERLTVRAPFDGTVRDVDSELAPNLWVGPRTALAMVARDDATTVRGYVEERYLRRFQPGAEATFVPENPDLARTDLTVRSVARTAADRLEHDYLALPNGGPIAVSEAEEGQRPRPLDAHYHIALAPVVSTKAPDRAVRGTAIVEGLPESFYTRAKRQVLKVLVREMGV